MTKLMTWEEVTQERVIVDYLVLTQRCTVDDLVEYDLIQLSSDPFENVELGVEFLQHLVHKGMLNDNGSYYCLSEKAKKAYHHYELVVSRYKDTRLYQPYMDETVAVGHDEILSYLSYAGCRGEYTLSVR
jgi:hypothetical protein